MEIWDAYYRDGTRAGKELIRGEKIPAGLYHMGCEVLVRHTDGTFLLMQRDWQKSGYPGWLEATAGGAAQKGEEPLDCIRRELYEETGIRGENFEPVGCHISDAGQGICWSYLCVTAWDKTAITLQEGETVAFKWVSEAEFLAFVNSDQVIPSQKKRLEDTLRKIGLLRE